MFGFSFIALFSPLKKLHRLSKGLGMTETHFVRCGYEVFNKLIKEKKFSMNFLKEMFPTYNHKLLSMVENERDTLASLLQRAYVWDKNDTAKEIVFLRGR